DRTQKCQIDPSFPVKCNSDLARISLDLMQPTGQPSQTLHFWGSGREWYRPRVLDELQRLKKQFVLEAGRGQGRLGFGNTGSGGYPQESPRYFIDLSGIAELRRIAEVESGIQFGAGVSIQALVEFATAIIGRRTAEETAGLTAL